eukprot:CAMPEP_0201550316 /NCGR_PEP_ID=MMETSP0173_2-20130828/6692_1 /ASSEMBLY_ACC=CAM_ASM_000268 /TAXON_ID=218659 /ORGANISM="Vexillifera sp., Strain DIVA3 564/2" /LENGTH=494 /DNA_ID=CAMNT_0047960257 /DNA_START=614 /DNA_END=2098 /DNA_ORIENTATION=-
MCATFSTNTTPIESAHILHQYIQSRVEEAFAHTHPKFTSGVRSTQPMFDKYFLLSTGYQASIGASISSADIGALSLRDNALLNALYAKQPFNASLVRNATTLNDHAHVGLFSFFQYAHTWLQRQYEGFELIIEHARQNALRLRTEQLKRDQKQLDALKSEHLLRRALFTYANHFIDAQKSLFQDSISLYHGNLLRNGETLHAEREASVDSLSVVHASHRRQTATRSRSKLASHANGMLSRLSDQHLYGTSQLERFFVELTQEMESIEFEKSSVAHAVANMFVGQVSVAKSHISFQSKQLASNQLGRQTKQMIDSKIGVRLLHILNDRALSIIEKLATQKNLNNEEIIPSPQAHVWFAKTYQRFVTHMIDVQCKSMLQDVIDATLVVKHQANQTMPFSMMALIEGKKKETSQEVFVNYDKVTQVALQCAAQHFDTMKAKACQLMITRMKEIITTLPNRVERYLVDQLQQLNKQDIEKLFERDQQIEQLQIKLDQQ